MGLKKRLFAVALLACLLAGGLGVGISGRPVSEEREESLFAHQKDTLYFWYADEALTDLLNSAAVAYGETHEDVRIIPVLASGLEYLEEINRASVQSETIPDLYIVSNDSLEKAYLAGLAGEVSNTSWECDGRTYPEAALQAVSYHGRIIGYPFYFETSALLYNRTYLEELAQRQLEAEKDAREGEEAMEQLESEGAPEESGLAEGDMPDLPEENVEAPVPEDSHAAAGGQDDVDARVEELLPSAIEDILTFANEYDAPEQVEAVFKWDVTDIFYNYFFVGNAINVGGAAGDDLEQIDIYNPEAIECLRVYQDLNQFFSIDTKEISYDSVLDDFMNGELVFTIATTDAVAKLEQAREEGKFNYDYGIARIPDINSGLQTSSLSVTSAVVVNGYSENQRQANDFARFLTCEYADNLYARTGKVPSRYGVDYGNPHLDKFVEDYEASVPMPKMIETSNFWVQLEIAFSQIWDGADANERLKELSEQIMTQVNGEPYTEEKIEEPERQEAQEEEYLD